MNDMSTAIPSGQSVPFVIVPHTSLDEVNFGSPFSGRLVAAGIMMITTANAIMLNVDPKELVFASHLVGNEDMNAWMIMRKLASKNV